MISGAVILLALGCCWYVVAGIRKEMNIITSIVWTITGYVFSHIMISGFLFWVDEYSIKRTIVLCLLAWMALAVVAVIRHKKPAIDWNIRNYVIPILVAGLCLPFVIQTFEFYGFGQDEGVYQTQALCFIHGITEGQIDFPEYYRLESEEQKQLYTIAVSTDNLVGFYQYYNAEGNYYMTQAEDMAISQYSGVFHGIPTFSALLALWGYLFGYENMTGINTVLFLCNIFLLYAILHERCQLKKLPSLMGLVIYACSPIVFWAAKSSLTETGLTLIWLAFLYCILGTGKKNILASAGCIVAYGFYHVSIFVFMPLYVLLYLGLYLYSKDKAYAKAMIISTLGYIIGYWMMQTIGAKYTNGNYERIYVAFINDQTMPYIAMIASAIVLLLAIFLICKKKEWKWKLLRKHLAWAARISIVLLLAVMVIRLLRKDLELQQFANVTLVAFIILSGVVVPIMVLIHTIVKTERWLEDRNKGILLALFIYCVIAYSSVMTVSAAYYYYYMRYLVMYIPILAIMGGILLNRCRIWQGIVATACGILLLFPFNICLLREKDDSRIEWSTIQTLSEVVQPGDILVMDKSLFPYYYFPLRAITKAEIYPVLETPEGDNLTADELLSGFQQLPEHSGNVYYLTYYYAAEAENWCTLERKIRNIGSEDYNIYYGDVENASHHPYLQLPLHFVETRTDVYLYRYVQ